MSFHEIHDVYVVALVVAAIAVYRRFSADMLFSLDYATPPPHADIFSRAMISFARHASRALHAAAAMLVCYAISLLLLD